MTIPAGIDLSIATHSTKFLPTYLRKPGSSWPAQEQCATYICSIMTETPDWYAVNYSLPTLLCDNLVRNRVIICAFFHDRCGLANIHAQGKESHPRRAVRLAKRRSIRHGLRSIEESNVVQPQESTLKDVVALSILSIHPPILTIAINNDKGKY